MSTKGINRRWEQGIDHHPLSRRIYDVIKRADWEEGGDYFCWKDGGDGDNGEHLMYTLDEFIESLGVQAVKDILEGRDREQEKKFIRNQQFHELLSQGLSDHGFQLVNTEIGRDKEGLYRDVTVICHNDIVQTTRIRIEGTAWDITDFLASVKAVVEKAG